MTLNHCRELEGLLTKKNKHLMQARESRAAHMGCGSAMLFVGVLICFA